MRFRLLAAGIATLAVALLIAGWSLQLIHERNLERRIIAELSDNLRQVIAGLSIGADGAVTIISEPADPRFEQPLSGLYWQVEGAGGKVASSRSLWDGKLPVLAADDPAPGERHGTVHGPDGTRLLLLQRRFLTKQGETTHTFLVSAAVHRAELANAADDFRKDLTIALVVLGACLFSALLLAIQFGLSPLNELKAEIGRLRAGEIDRLEGQLPTEVAPLADDLNQLLEHQHNLIERAQARAADFAHALKTPLTALSALSDELRGGGKHEMAGEISDHVHSMLGHTERELAYAQSVASVHKPAFVQLKPVLERMVATMRRLPRGSKIKWDIDVPPEIHVRAGESALAEVLGNILDNARKWAKGSVRISVESKSGSIQLTVSDDGPGIPHEKLHSVMERGARLDETAPGSGFGLAIAKDISQQSGHMLELSTKPGGGLCVHLTFSEHIR